MLQFLNTITVETVPNFQWKLCTYSISILSTQLHGGIECRLCTAVRPVMESIGPIAVTAVWRQFVLCDTGKHNYYKIGETEKSILIAFLI